MKEIAMTSLRANLLTKPIHKWAKGVLPALSQTESEALTVGGFLVNRPIVDHPAKLAARAVEKRLFLVAELGCFDLMKFRPIWIARE